MREEMILRDAENIDPEQFIWVAVIKQAIEDLTDIDDEVVRSAYRWIFEWRKTEMELFNSFINVCGMLCLDPVFVRDKIYEKVVLGGQKNAI